MILILGFFGGWAPGPISTRVKFMFIGPFYTFEIAKFETAFYIAKWFK